MIPKYYKENYVIAKDNTIELIIVALILIFFVGAWVVIVLYAKDKTPVNPTTKNLNQQQVQETGLSNIYGTNNGKEYGTLAVYEACPIGQCPTNINTGEKRCSANPAIQLLYDPTTEECNPRNSCTGVTTQYGVLADGSTSLDGSCDPNSQCRCVNTLYTPSYIQSIFNVTNGSILQSNPQNINKWYFTQSSTTSTGQGNNIPFSYTDPTSQFYQISNDLLIAVQSTKCADLYKNLNIGDSIGISDTLTCINSNPCIQGAMAYILPYSNAGQDTFSTTGSYANFDLVNNFNTLPLSCVPNSVENPYTDPDILDTGKYNVCYDFQAPVFNFSTGKIHCMNPKPEVVLKNVQTSTASTAKEIYVETTLILYTSPILPTPIPYITPDFTQQRLNVYGVTSGEDISFVVTVTKNDSFYVPTPIDLPNLQQNANFVKINPDGTINVIQSGINFTPDTATTVIYRYDGFNSYLGGTSITSTNNGIYAFEIVNYSYVYGTSTIQSSNTYLTDLASIVVTKNQ